MGGRQKAKKIQDNVNETDIQTVSRPAEAENIAEEKVAMATLKTEHKTLKSGDSSGVALTESRIISPSNEEFKALRQLSDVRIDDPRVISLSPTDPRLILDKFNVRKEKDRNFVERLHRSMVEDGQQRAILLTPRVTPRGEELWIVTGNTRERAAMFKEKGGSIDKIFVLSAELTDEQAWFLALESNLDNDLPMDALNDEEEGLAILRLMEEYKWTQERVADLMHRDKSWVSRQVHLAKIEPQIDNMVKGGAITESHAEVIMTLPKNFQGQIADQVEFEKFTVQQTQKLINDFKAVLNVAEGIPDDVLGETILNPFLDGDMKLEKAVEATKAVSAGLKLLSSDIKETGYRREESFATTVIEKKMDPQGAHKFAESLNTLAKETEELPKEARDNIVENVLDGIRGLEAARIAIRTIQIASRSKSLPKHIRELAVKEFGGSKYRGIGKYDVEAAQKLVTTLETVFDDAVKKFSAGTQKALAERIIEKKYKVETAQKLANTIQAALEDSKDLPNNSLRATLIKHIIEHNYTADSASQLVAAVNRAIMEKKGSYEIESELSWHQPKDWKILKLTPEMEAAHKEDEEQRRLDEEADSAAKLDDMVRNGELTSSSADLIRVLPKILQGEVAESLTYYDGDGNEQQLSPDGIQKMVSAVQRRIEVKTPDAIRRLIQTRALDNTLDAERYFEKSKEEPAAESTEPIVAESAEAKEEKAQPEEGISEQLFGRHISGDVPAASAASTVPAEISADLPTHLPTEAEAQASSQILETAEKLDSTAATSSVALTEVAAATGVKTSIVQRAVNKAGSTVLKFVCPCCDERLVLDPLKMVANWQEADRRLEVRRAVKELTAGWKNDGEVE